jgi:N-6 DNA Methylase
MQQGAMHIGQGSVCLTDIKRDAQTMGNRSPWWDAWQHPKLTAQVKGLVRVRGYRSVGRPPEEVAIMEKAEEYGADAVFFEVEQYGRRASAQAFIYGTGTLVEDQDFAECHRKLWSWGGVPLVYRRTPGLLQLYRCAHRPDFLAKDGRIVCNPIKQLNLAAQIECSPWWDEERISSGTLWTDPKTCELLLSNRNAAHKSLFDAFKRLSSYLDAEKILPKRLRRRLLILSLLIAYLEQRGVFDEGFFSAFLPGAQRFLEVLKNGPALVKLMAALEDRFNGNVFSLDPSEVEKLLSTQDLERFAKMIEARESQSGQLSLWELYSFRDLPVELISQIYQLFVENAHSSVYTPPLLIQFLVEEALSWNALDHITLHHQVVLDPACGSGVFLVEAYKRLVLHWRLRHQWRRPNKEVLQGLLAFVHGVDLEEDAVELAGFSLCLAMCDALQPAEIRHSIKLFPNLRRQTLHHGCFFEAKEAGLLPARIGAVLGNPPFASTLQTPATQRAYARYLAEHHKKLPDKQAGYLFLHEASEIMEDGATISMLQQYNFLYNQHSLAFRQDYLERYWVREILDFVSVRGLFQKGDADTKIIVVVAQKKARPDNATLLHATFRRTGRIDAEQGLDLDYYDLHVVPYGVALANDRLWRANLLGGGRVLSFVNRLAQFQTLREFAIQRDWDVGEGFIVGKSVQRKPAPHLTGHPYMPSEALTIDGIDKSKILPLEDKFFRSGYTKRRFTPPMLLVREQMQLAHTVWDKSYLTYSQQVVGFCAPSNDHPKLKSIDRWMTKEIRTLRAYLALTSPRLFAQRATALQADDIYSIPYPPRGSFDLSENERILVDDIVDYQSDLIRLGEASMAMRQVGDESLRAYANVLSKQVNALYGSSPSFSLRAQFTWSGAVCQAYAFGNAQVDWSGAEELQGRIAALLQAPTHRHLTMTRICRLYDNRFLFILKPDRLRYWIRSVGLRDADDVLTDLRAQGY